MKQGTPQINSLPLKIVPDMKDPRPQASSRHSGQGVFSTIDPPPGRPVGDGIVHRNQ
jgi:hypothetical protein